MPCKFFSSNNHVSRCFRDNISMNRGLPAELLSISCFPPKKQASESAGPHPRRATSLLDPTPAEQRPCLVFQLKSAKTVIYAFTMWYCHYIKHQCWCHTATSSATQHKTDRALVLICFPSMRRTALVSKRL